MEHETDDVLAVRARDGDPAALAELYRRHAPPLLAYLTRCVGSAADAEDVLHDTFARLLERRGRYDGQGRFRPWLYTIATNLLRDQRRREQHRRHERLDASGAGSQPASAIALPERSIGRGVNAALAALPQEAAAVVWLRVHHGFSYRDLAEIFGEPEGTLRSRLHHALRQLRGALWQGRPDTARSPAPRSRAADRDRLA